MYNYFISYTAKGKDKWRETTVTGNNEVEIDRKIEDLETIREIEKHVCEKFGFSNVVITNYIFLHEKGKDPSEICNETHNPPSDQK